MTKLGVIVAAYNVENEILRCLESLHNQNFEDAQFIIVNDGSTDRTQEIVEKYIGKIKDSRFKLYNKKNGGLSSTRNYGLQKLTSEFVLFVDGDDEVSKNRSFFKIISEKMSEDSLDLIEFNYLEQENGKITKTFANRKSTDVILGIELFYQSIHSNRFNAYVWHYAYSMEFLKSHAFWFKEGIFIEDVPFIIPILVEAPKTEYINEIGYTYIRRDNTITNNFNIEHRKQLVKDHISVLKKVNQKIENTKIDLKYMGRIDNLLARAFMVNIIKAKGYDISITKNEINDFLKNKKLTRANQIKKEVILKSPQIIINTLSKLMIKIFP